LDAACREHDIVYSRSRDFMKWYVADKILAEEARKRITAKDLTLGEKFVRQSQTIKVTNVDNKVQTEKEIRKHGNMLPISIFGTICDLSNCGNTNMLINLLINQHTFWEHVPGVQVWNDDLRNRWLTNAMWSTKIYTPFYCTINKCQTSKVIWLKSVCIVLCCCV